MHLFRQPISSTGSIYIGKTLAGIKHRRGSHIRNARHGAKQPFPCAIRKHGPEAFSWQEIYSSNNHDALMAAEIELIAAYKAAGSRMYNATAGGEGASRKRSEAEIAAMRLRRLTDETKKKMSDAWTPERKAAQAEVMRNRVFTEKSRAKLSHARTGMVFTPEHREAIRISKLGNTSRLGTGRKVR